MKVPVLFWLSCVLLGAAFATPVWIVLAPLAAFCVLGGWYIERAGE